jgi:hypothetical protein
MFSHDGLYLCRQRPTLPHTFAYSTIGPAGLNFRVRDGNGWFPRGKITDNLIMRNLQRTKLVCYRFSVFGSRLKPMTDNRTPTTKDRERCHN